MDSEDEVSSNAEDGDVISLERKRRRLDDSSDVECSEEDLDDDSERGLSEGLFTRNITLQVLLHDMLICQ
jgi:hypothetical protein